MKTRTMLTAVLLTAVIGLAAAPASAELVPITSITGSNGGDRYANGMDAMNNGSGITKADPADPSTWTFDGSHYNTEWMGWYFPTPALNNKLAWASFDLGASTPLQDLYLFNNNYQNGISGVSTYNLYTADSPTVALPAQPAKNQFSNTGLTPQGDYDFSSGGWTKVNAAPLTVPKAGTGVEDLSGTSARYIGVEILTNHGDTYNGGRVGLEEVAVTLGSSGPAPAAPVGQLGILDTSGTNPATGQPWAVGDTYRLAFVTGGTRDATSPDIADYHAFVQAAADAAGLGGTWKCIGQSANDPDRHANTGMPNEDSDIPIFFVDGTTKLADDYADLWNGPDVFFNMTETLGTYDGNVATGSSRKFGDPLQGKIEHGNSNRTNGQWWQVYNGNQTSPWHFYAVSDELTVQEGGEIPEPATMALLGLAAAGLGGYVRRRRTA